MIFFISFEKFQPSSFQIPPHPFSLFLEIPHIDICRQIMFYRCLLHFSYIQISDYIIKYFQSPIQNWSTFFKKKEEGKKNWRKEFVKPNITCERRLLEGNSTQLNTLSQWIIDNYCGLTQFDQCTAQLFKNLTLCIVFLSVYLQNPKLC